MVELEESVTGDPEFSSRNVGPSGSAADGDEDVVTGVDGAADNNLSVTWKQGHRFESRSGEKINGSEQTGIDKVWSRLGLAWLAAAHNVQSSGFETGHVSNVL